MNEKITPHVTEEMKQALREVTQEAREIAQRDVERRKRLDLEGLPGVTDMNEADPNGVLPGQPGAKLDAGKVLAGVLGDFGLALQEVAKVGTFGAQKYVRHGWESVPDGIVRYNDAGWRHLLMERYQSTAPDSGLLHLAHRAWNTLAELELVLRHELNIRDALAEMDEE